MTYWLLTIIMVHGQVEHGHLLEKANCVKLGKELTKIIKPSQFTCKKVFVELQ